MAGSGVRPGKLHRFVNTPNLPGWLEQGRSQDALARSILSPLDLRFQLDVCTDHLDIASRQGLRIRERAIGPSLPGAWCVDATCEHRLPLKRRFERRHDGLPEYSVESAGLGG